MKFGYLNEMCDECAEAAEMGVETSCCGEESMEVEMDTCDMCGMPMQDNLCDCCADAASEMLGHGGHNHGGGHGHHGHHEHDEEVVHVSLGERYEFDKFMDNILIKESRRPRLGDSPLWERVRRHQDRPNNRIRYGVKS